MSRRKNFKLPHASRKSRGRRKKPLFEVEMLEQRLLLSGTPGPTPTPVDLQSDWANVSGKIVA